MPHVCTIAPPSSESGGFPVICWGDTAGKSTIESPSLLPHPPEISQEMPQKEGVANGQVTPQSKLQEMFWSQGPMDLSQGGKGVQTSGEGSGVKR